MTPNAAKLPFSETLLRYQPEVLSGLPASAQTEALCLAAVRQNRRALHYIQQQTPPICQAAVRHDGLALEHVQEQTLALCLDAVQQEGLALVHVRQQTPEICRVAIEQRPGALHVVKDQTVELCVAAVEQQGDTLEFVRLPHDRLLDPASHQLDDWLTVLRACASTDSTSVHNTLLPLIAAMPLGKQYCDEWCQRTPSGSLLFERLLLLVAEIARLAPIDPEVIDCAELTRVATGDAEVKSMRQRALQQQEWILRRQLIARTEEGSAPLDPVKQDLTL